MNPEQIPTVIRTFRDKQHDIFPGRDEVPKTLIFAKTERQRIEDRAGGVALTAIAGNLLAAIDPDRIDAKAREIDATPQNAEPTPHAIDNARKLLAADAASIFTGDLIELIDSIRGTKEQTIDHDSLDTVQRAEWEGDPQENARAVVREFREYLEANRDEVEALTIYYGQPHRRREITYFMIRAVFQKLAADKPRLAPHRVWQAYALLDDYQGQRPTTELTALVGLIRRACGIDSRCHLTTRLCAATSRPGS